ncbi:MAG: hypothetical protein M1827_004444 [Pycnora praestabilis]|nr:MAG: hypothetical protein M1827_004444 [Pycnora praestabilis]
MEGGLSNKTPNHKVDVRQQVWSELIKVALPDSRFHFDFAEFIPDFEGSSAATDLLVRQPWYISARIIFITPDNCLEDLRLVTLRAGKRILITTYGIRRGFWLLDPKDIPSAKYEYASTLDGLEKLARPVKLEEMITERLHVDLLVTGTGAINMEGIRFGKGHGYFDLEWGMLYSVGIVTSRTHTAAVVHDCQVLTSQLSPEEFDTVCDLIITPTQVIEVPGAKKPECGIIWDELETGMMGSIPPLQELKDILSSNDSAVISLQ